MKAQLHTFDILTDGAGAFVDTGSNFDGAVLQMRYVPDGSSPLDTGVDIKLELVKTGVVIADYDNIGSAAKTFVPRQPVNDTGGALIAGLRDRIYSAGDMLRLTVAQSGGVAFNKRGKVLVWTGDA